MRLEGKISPLPKLPIALYGKSSAIGEPVFLVGKIYGSVTACAINFERNAVSLFRPKDEFFFRPTAFFKFETGVSLYSFVES